MEKSMKVLLPAQTVNNEDLAEVRKKRKLYFHVCRCENLAVRNSHFLLGLRLRLMGGGVTSLWRLGRWHREALLPLRAGNVAENPGKSK